MRLPKLEDLSNLFTGRWGLRQRPLKYAASKRTMRRLEGFVVLCALGAVVVGAIIKLYPR
jgi:hypothetical protein